MDADELKAHGCYSGLDRDSLNCLASTVGWTRKLTYGNTSYTFLLDIINYKILYASENTEFLCEIPANDILQRGFRFFEEFIPLEDRKRFDEVFSQLILFLRGNGICRNDRFMLNYSIKFKNKTGRIVHYNVTPALYSNRNKLWVVLCTLTPSSRKSSGNYLLTVEKLNRTFVYSFETNQWKPFSPVKLSERERTVLYLSCQGQTTRDIAKSLPFSYGTINRIKDRIFEITETSSIMEATTFCINNRMV